MLLPPGHREAGQGVQEIVDVEVVVIVQVAEPVLPLWRVEEGGKLCLHLAAERGPAVVGGAAGLHHLSACSLQGLGKRGGGRGVGEEVD